MPQFSHLFKEIFKIVIWSSIVFIRIFIMSPLKLSWVRHILKGLLLVLAATIFYNEWLALKFEMQSWEAMAVGQHYGKGVAARVLLVADPQMLSPLSEPYFPLSLLAIWDANRFMRRGFQAALSTAKPDVVVFLGDLLNDGSVASDSEFNNMKNNFLADFAVPETVKLVIYLPGDNDVGGEAGDLLTVAKIARFQKAFPMPSSLHYMFMEMVPVSPALGSSSPPILETPPGVLRLLLSHSPLLPSTLNRKRLQAEKPTLIFSGHFHESFHFSGDKSKFHASKFWPFNERGTVLNFTLFSDEVHEIIVPTCNYRMGKKSYGFGLAVLDSTGWLEYGVLWLPSRFWQLQLYCCIMSLMFLLLLLPNILRLCYAVYCYSKLLCRSTAHQNPATKLTQTRKGYVQLVPLP
ncbi:uncharacterized protein C630.12 [Hyalella azteca]|uniref:Uncharacterized protein C630.12 n=1 Tax=Hyalella azteca TaxID=294128 RepID=A0A8B7PQK7_HYAAZ|nr:uncharacterized protein C630.12 [Hyalella azteca]